MKLRLRPPRNLLRRRKRRSSSAQFRGIADCEAGYKGLPLFLCSLLRPGNLRAAFMPPGPLWPWFVGLNLHVGQLFADAVAELCDAVAQCRGPLEIELLGGSVHFL